MKRNTKNLLTLSVAFLAAGLFYTGYIGADVDATADTLQNVTYTVGGEIESFQLNQKASIRKVNPTGIRFTTSIGETDKKADATFGTLVIPKAVLGNADLTIENAKATNIVTEKWTDETKIAYYSVLTEIPETYYNTALVARSYMLDGDTVYYTNTTERSLGYVAVLALETGDNSQLLDTIAAKTEKTLTLNAETLTLNSDNTTATLEATAMIGGIAYEPTEYTWVSSDADVVSVENGELTALKEGKATITVKCMR